MHFLIYGTGAVGGMLGARLALAGEQVTFLIRPRYQDLFSRGITLELEGESTVLPDPVCIETLTTTTRPVDVILLCVKAYDLDQAVADIQGHNAGCPIVSFLNGVEAEAEIASRIGSDMVIPATLTSAVSRPSANHFVVARERGVGFGGPHPLVPELARIFTAAGFHTLMYDDSQAMKWSKLISNITANAIAAILGWPAGDVFRCPTTYHLELLALRETLDVMQMLHLRVVPLPKLPLHLLPPALRLPDFILRPVLHRMVAGGRGGKPPSFSFDIQRGRSEVQWLNGAVARTAKELGMTAPVNEALTTILTDLVEGHRQPDTFRDNPGFLLQTIDSFRQTVS